MKYYRLHDKNSAYPDRWYLGSPTDEKGAELDARMFLMGRRLEMQGALSLPIVRAGAPQEFTMGDFDVPILASPFIEELRRLTPDDVQVIPVNVEDGEHQYYLLNVLRVIDCLDESRSTVVRWPADAFPKDLAGSYLTVSDIHVDETKVAGAHMFRIEGWQAALIVSEEVGALLADASGVVLERV